MEKELSPLYSYCEICNINPASEMKGGVYKNERNLWLCCKECLHLIEDSRKNRR